MIDPGDAAAFGIIIRGHDLRYDVAAARFTWLGHTIPAPRDGDGHLRLQLLVDRTSLELYTAGGLVSASFCFLPAACDMPLELYAAGGSVRLVSLAIHELNSVWPQAHGTGR